MAPMGVFGFVTQDNCFNERAKDYFVERARGGVGLIITGLAKIENEVEKFKAGLVPITSTNPSHFITTAGEMTEAVHSYGTKIFLQLGIGFGRVGHPSKLDNGPVAPSAIPNYWETRITCRELTTQEVELLVTKAGEAASIARESGFDGVEIHAVHEGYLLDQFTIAMFNHRTDKYGGDLRGRLTLPIEILQEIKRCAGQDYPVQMRLGLKSYIKDWGQGGLPEEEFMEKGRDIAEGLEVAKILEAAGYDSLNADTGSYDAWYWAHPPGYMKHGLNLGFTEKLKKVVTIPVIVAGRMELPDMAAQALQDSQADMVSLGRGLLSDPNWPNKVASGEINKIRPCLGCHDGCMWRGYKGKPLSCAVNPSCGREREYALQKASVSKKVAVVGGGMAGMEAARVAASRGHQVTLYEKSPRLGGHVIAACIPENKDDEARLINWYENELTQLGVTIQLNCEVKPALLEEHGYAEIIVATGSTAIIPAVPGVKKENVASAIEILLGKKQAGRSVVIVGGGLVGCETALWLKAQGKEVTIVEMAPELMAAGASIPHMNRMMLLDMLKYRQVKIVTNTALLEVLDQSAVVINKDFMRQEIPVDTVILSVGYKANQQLYRELPVEYRANTHVIGDAREPKNIMNAIWDAYEIARNL
ncbi:MAG: Cinnamate reductase [Candidatus Dichloromethanomonas elyunquensis]|nr:MAG: Cinnamate reductase [Candidatus Dichloromethanomonas elyunquensis]